MKQNIYYGDSRRRWQSYNRTIAGIWFFLGKRSFFLPAANSNSILVAMSKFFIERSVRMTGESNVENMYGRPDQCEADPNYTLRPTLVDHPQERHDDDNSWTTSEWRCWLDQRSNIKQQRSRRLGLSGINETLTSGIFMIEGESVTLVEYQQMLCALALDAGDVGWKLQQGSLTHGLLKGAIEHACLETCSARYWTLYLPILGPDKLGIFLCNILRKRYLFLIHINR